MTIYYILPFYVWMVRTLRISLSNLQVYNTVLTVVTMVYIGALELIHPIAGSLYPLTNVSPFPHSTPNPQAILLSIPMSSSFLDSIYTKQYLSLSNLIPLCIMSSGSIHVTNGKISFFLMAE